MPTYFSAIMGFYSDYIKTCSYRLIFLPFYRRLNPDERQHKAPYPPSLFLATISRKPPTLFHPFAILSENVHHHQRQLANYKVIGVKMGIHSGHSQESS